MTSTHILTRGDIVKLKQPYRHEEWVRRKPKDWKGFEFGIVVEIVSHQFTINGDRYGNTQIPRQVSLHLYDAMGQLFIVPEWIEKGLMVPSYVDFHLSELILYRIASDDDYITITDPPDWDRLWDEEMSILKEFEG